ncbi:MAG: DUF6034 family protein [Oscillospiraceae bacterium]|jgi:hypothetical protein|nr:DUF6034 family protein [Oscillospiraceae bacterium]
MKKLTIKGLFVLFSFLTCIIFNGCQNSNDTAVSPYTAPKNWIEAYETPDNKLTVNVDAKVIIPSFDKYPVYSAVNEEDFQGLADNLISVLMKDKDVFDMKSIYDDTKSEITERIEFLQIQIAEIDEELKQEAVSDAGITKEETLEIKAGFEIELDYLQKKLPSAPEAFVQKLSNGKLKTYEDMYGGYTELLNVETKIENGKKLVLSIDKKEGISKYYTPNRVEYNIINNNKGFLFAYNDWNQTDINEINLSKEDAIEKTKSFLNEIGFTGMNFFDIGAVSHVNLENLEMDETDKCYGVTFTRIINSIQLGMVNNISHTPYHEETITVAVSDNGIEGFSYISPKRVTGTISENIKLLPFAEIQSVFKTQSKFNNIEDFLYDDIDKINITRVELNYAYIQSDKDAEFKITPVWDFFGDPVMNDDDDTYNLARAKYNSFLTIDAVTGDVVKRNSWA